MKDPMGDPYIEAFARRLTALRLKKGQSARDMSLSLGQSHNYINGLESARNYPSMQTFFYICESLGVTPQEFFAYENADPARAGELYAEIKKLDARSRAYFLDLIKDINRGPKG